MSHGKNSLLFIEGQGQHNAEIAAKKMEGFKRDLGAL
jgi:hypothetical protein